MDEYFTALDEKKKAPIKSFADTLQGTLKLFEKAEEWADLMKALDKLESVFASTKFFYRHRHCIVHNDMTMGNDSD